ncbi:MAG: peptide ABC transporter substrate-binding protein [Spirochaetales bacterium]|nr:peptide ABC transporter substrate-binding protein [Spirochaetales bacterium]
MKRTIAILLVLVSVFSLVFAQGAKEATVTKEVENAVEEIIAEVYKGADYVDPIKGWGRYDALIAAIKAETDTAKRTEMMHEAEDILMSNWCVIPIYYYNDLYMQKSYVSGVYSNPFATKFFQYASLSNGSKTLRINLASEPDYLDPALNSSVDGACLAAASFAGLYTYNAQGVTAPALAEGYTVSSDGLTYTVTLKKDLKWSDGSALTANDFVYSWKRAVSPDTAADYEYMFSGFAGYEEGDLQVKAIDDNTLEFKLIAPCAYIEDLMAFPTFFPVKQAAVESYADWKTSPGGWCQEAGFVSNGPFVCTGWNHDVSMTYEKNPYYYDAANVQLEKLEFMLSADDNAIFAAYNAGNLDLIDSVPTDEVANLIASKNPEFHVVDELGTYYVAFNAKSSLFNGKSPAQAACIREAFSILIDRDYICENIGQTGQVAANAYIPLGMADGNGGIFKESAEAGYYDAYAINNDPAGTVNKAIALLKAAGYKFGEDKKLSAETPISLTYLTNTSSGHIAIAESIQQDLAAVGINLTIQQQDWNVFLEERKNGNFDFAREGWIADFNDPINMLEMWTTTSGNNDCQFGR